MSGVNMAPVAALTLLYSGALDFKYYLQK